MMDIENVKIIDLVMAEDNVRLHPKNQIAEYRRSLKMFGQTKNAVIDEDNNVLIGNGLVIAAREEGWNEIAVVRRTDLTKNQKSKLMVSDNKIFSLGIDNLDIIDDIFKQLIGDLDVPGYEEQTLKDMMADAQSVTDSLIQYGVLDSGEVSSIKNRTFDYMAPTRPIIEEGTDRAKGDPNDDGETNNDRMPIKCPKCGDEIWLSKDALRQLTS